MDELKKTLAIVRTCLIVMDNVWEMDNVTWLSDLGSLLSTTTERSCIIITTRKQHLPSTMKADNLRTHTHQPLDAKNSWSLFTEFAFSGSSECSEIDFEKVGRDIVKKCGGLPLAIKVIGSLLKSKGKNLGAWKNAKTLFLDQFSTKENEVMDSLRLSYNDLPPHLKQCLLCLSIYPEGPEIRVEQLIHWWIAEDFVKETRSKTAMEWGYQYVLELINRSLVEVTKHRHYDGRVDSCKLHDMVRELIMKIAEEEGFCSFEGNGTSYWFGLTGEHDTKSLSKNLKLRALFLFTPRCQVDFNRNVISLLSLRVLDFSGTISNFDVKQVKNLLDWIGSLKRLACLNLSEAKVLLELPSSICELFNLQFLVLRDCTNLDKIHTSITNLKKLIVLDLKSCRLRHFPRGLGCLSNLQELSGFKVLIGQAENKGRGLCELKSLTHLRVLSIVISTTVNDAKLSKHELGILSTLNKLEVLAIDADKRQEKHIFDIVERCLIPPQSLLELYLRNFYFETMPHWSGPEKLSSLQYLCIEDAEIKSLIPDQVKNRTPESPWNVNLCLKSLFQLEEDWEELQKIMRVQSLEVNKCDEEKLKNFPCSVNEPGYWPDKET